MFGDGGHQIRRVNRDRLSRDGASGRKKCSPVTRTQHESGPYLRTDPSSKVGTGPIIDRNGNHSTKRASQKCRHPLGAVRTPQQHRIPPADVASLKLAGKLIRYFGNALVAPTLMPVTARKHVGAVVLLAPALEIIQRIQYTCPHTLFSSTILRTLPALTVKRPQLHIKLAHGSGVPVQESDAG